MPYAIINGGIREKLLIPSFGEKISFPVSGVMLCVMIYVIGFVLLPKLKCSSKRDFRNIGILWVTATLVFEFSMGAATGLSFREMLKAYDFTTGNLWLFIVIFIGFTPSVINRQKRLLYN